MKVLAINVSNEQMELFKWFAHTRFAQRNIGALNLEEVIDFPYFFLRDKRGGEYSLQTFCERFTHSLQNRFPVPIIATEMENKSLWKTYYVLFEENHTHYTFLLNSKNGTEFTSMGGIILENRFIPAEQKEDIDRLTYYREAVEKSISEQPDCRLFEATGMLTFIHE